MRSIGERNGWEGGSREKNGPAASHLHRKTAGGRPNPSRLQHPEGVDSPPRAPPPWWRQEAQEEDLHQARASPTHTNFYTISSKWCKIQLQPTPFLTPFHQNLVQMNSATPNLVFHYLCNILFFLVLLFNF